MKGFAFLALCLGLVAAGPSHDITAHHRAIVEARQGCAGTGGWDSNCHVPGSPDQSIANRVLRVCNSRGLNAKQKLAVFETALVESNMHNLPCGHADSVGVFQQRPCAGWGSVAQCMDVERATGKFIDGVLRCSQNNPGGAAAAWAQCVQGSEIPSAYYQKESAARALLSKTEGIVGGGGSSGGDGGSSNVGGNPSSGGSSSGGSCTSWKKPQGGDTGSKFAGRYGISFTTLKNYNSNINASGSNLSTGTSYCVKRGGSSSSGGSSGGSSSGGSGCKKHATTKSGNTCTSFAKNHGITFTRLRQLNSNINASCSNLQANKSYCVG